MVREGAAGGVADAELEFRRQRQSLLHRTLHPLRVDPPLERAIEAGREIEPEAKRARRRAQQAGEIGERFLDGAADVGSVVGLGDRDHEHDLVHTLLERHQPALGVGHEHGDAQALGPADGAQDLPDVGHLRDCLGADEGAGLEPRDPGVDQPLADADLLVSRDERDDGLETVAWADFDDLDSAHITPSAAERSISRSGQAEQAAIDFTVVRAHVRPGPADAAGARPPANIGSGAGCRTLP